MAASEFVCPNHTCIKRPASFARRQIPVAGAELWAIQCVNCGHVVHVEDPGLGKALAIGRSDGSMGYSATVGKKPGP
jgi:hypothetical protein